MSDAALRRRSRPADRPQGEGQHEQSRERRSPDCAVLDLTRLLPGPAATMHLADFGADVIKIEDTGAGDYMRDFPPQVPNAAGHAGQSGVRGHQPRQAFDLAST